MRQDIRRSRGIHETESYFHLFQVHLQSKVNIYCSPFSHILLRPI